MLVLAIILIAVAIFEVFILIDATKMTKTANQKVKSYENQFYGLKNDIAVQKEIIGQQKESINNLLDQLAKSEDKRKGLEDIIKYNKTQSELKEKSIQKLQEDLETSHKLWNQQAQELTLCEYYCRMMADQYNIPQCQRWEVLKKGQSDVVEFKDGDDK